MFLQEPMHGNAESEVSKVTEQKMYTLKEVSELLQIHRRTLYTWITKGKLITVKVGSQHRITQEELERIAKEGV